MALSPLAQVGASATGNAAANTAVPPANPAAESDAIESNVVNDSAFADVPKLGEKSPIENLELTRAKLDRQIAQMQETLTSRTQAPFDPMMMQVAAGFLKPTKTGSFGESLGSAAENAVAQQARNVELNRAQLESTMKMSESMRAQIAQQLMGQLYKTTKDANGKETHTLNTDVAKKLSEVTGDPKYIQAVVANQRQQALKEVGMNMFKPRETEDADGNKKTVYDFNPTAVYDIMKLSDNPLEDVAKYAEMIPKLRKAGLLSGMKGDESTPFDAMILMAPTPAIKQQAEYLAKQFRNGMIDDDKAYAMSNQMLTMATSHMDREQTRLFNQSMQTLMMGMRQESLDIKKSEQSNKLTDEQKIAYRQQIVPIVNKGQQAIDALSELDNLKSKFPKAPNGTFSGIKAQTWGALMGTDENTALREIDSITKRLMTTVPRLPGSQSNFDAQNIEKGLGRLTDVNLTNKQRLDIIQDVEKSYNNIKNRAMKVEDYWETNKKVLPLSEMVNPKAPEAPANPAAPKKVDNVTDADIKATAKKYGITEAEVKKRLGIE
jgi:hypothetical protein